MNATENSARVLHEGEFLRLLRLGHWEYVERTNSHGVAVIVAITEASELLLVEQFRFPLQRPVIELPAGLVGDVGEEETLLEAAQRELEEETGYRAVSMSELASGPTTAGLSNEITTFCKAGALTRVGPGGGDDTETITVHKVPLAGLRDWLSAQHPRAAIDPKLYAGLWLAGISPDRA
ncbi:MAG TPA: NUDIX hydrolase [Gammaproteobacteria bacterium]|nr:NUDIX hydrolase [Gammaproteobacteria bacterium]